MALELAAVRLGALSLDQLNDGLARGLSALGSGNRGAEARQRTLEATIGWSYGLLDDLEQLLWARLSVFAGGFDADSAIEVCADERFPADRVVAILGALVEKSIVRRALRSGNAPRYSLLETLRQFGRQRLQAIGEDDSAQRRHLDWIAGLAAVAGAFDDRQARQFQRMDEDRDNLWAALELCLSEPGVRDRGGELAMHLLAYWTCRGQFGDVRRMMMSLAELAPQDSLPRARFLLAAAVMANSQNDFSASASLGRDALRIATQVNDWQTMGLALAWLAIPLAIAGSLAEGTDAAEAALSIGHLHENRPIELVASAVLCNVLPMVGRPERAVEIGEQGLELSQQSGELWARGHLLMATAQAHVILGDRTLGEAQAREGAATKGALDDRAGLQALLETLASIAADSLAFERAARLLGCAEGVRRSNAIQFLEGYRQQHERSVAIALEGLGERLYRAAFQLGLAMTVEDALAFAVHDRTAPRSVVVKPVIPMLLTTRELEIAHLIAVEMTSREIATRLFISERTVETHVTNMLNKLGVNSRIEIARWLASTSGAAPTTTITGLESPA